MVQPGPLRALLLAPPGAGKGTQGNRLAVAFDVPHLATGDLLRSHVARGTSMGRAAASYMERGDLVPDQIVSRLVHDTIEGEGRLPGFVLDGYPRTMAQAVSARRWGQRNERLFHVVVALDVDEDELVKRLVERGRTSGRSDDNPTAIRERLAVFARMTQPLVDFYRERDVLRVVDGTGDIEQVFARVLDAVPDSVHPGSSDRTLQLHADD